MAPGTGFGSNATRPTSHLLHMLDVYKRQELERVEEENIELCKFREKFFAADKELAVKTEKLRGWGSMEVISTGCIAVGAAALVYVPEAWRTQPNGWIALTFGFVLTLVGILAKVIRI